MLFKVIIIALVVLAVVIFAIYLLVRLISWIFGGGKLQTKGKTIIDEELSDFAKKYGFGFPSNWGTIEMNNPFRGVFVVGGAGSGKSESLIKPIIWGAAKKGYCGIVYDFKYPELSLEVASAYDDWKPGVDFKMINFTELGQTKRCNPLAPRYIPTLSHAEEYATAIVNNLMPESIKKPDFWNRSAIALLQSTIWFFKEEYPEQCDLPHVVNLLQSPIHDIMKTLKRNETSRRLISSIITAYEQKAEGQLAGTIGTLQLALNKINTPEVAYVLGKDEINLNLNDPNNPTMLCIGNNPNIQDSLSPVISLVITVCLKMMNNQGKHHSVVILDEAPTIYIPKLETVPATARSNKISVVFCCQDFSQIIDKYGKDKKDAIIANLANQFYGRVSHYETADYMMKIAGKKEVWQESYSEGSSGKLFQNSSNTSRSLQEKQNLKIQDIQSFGQGKFLTVLVERGRVFYSKTKKAYPNTLNSVFTEQYQPLQVQRYSNFESNETPKFMEYQGLLNQNINKIIQGLAIVVVTEKIIELQNEIEVAQFQNQVLTDQLEQQIHNPETKEIIVEKEQDGEQPQEQKEKEQPKDDDFKIMM